MQDKLGVTLGSMQVKLCYVMLSMLCSQHDFNMRCNGNWNASRIRILLPLFGWYCGYSESFPFATMLLLYVFLSFFRSYVEGGGVNVMMMMTDSILNRFNNIIIIAVFIAN